MIPIAVINPGVVATVNLTGVVLCMAESTVPTVQNVASVQAAHRIGHHANCRQSSCFRFSGTYRHVRPVVKLSILMLAVAFHMRRHLIMYLFHVCRSLRCQSHLPVRSKSGDGLVMELGV
jgi:hypothetical protein